MHIREDGLITNIYPNNKDFDNIDKRCRRNSNTVETVLKIAVLFMVILILSI